MTQTKQYKMRDQDKKLLILPSLGEDILEQILKIKKKWNIVILLSLILTKFCVTLTEKITYYNSQQVVFSDNNSFYDWSSFFIGSVFLQIMIGFMTDLISVQVSWTFTTVISIFGIIIQILYLQFKNDIMFVVGQIVINCAFISNYVCGAFIIYNTSYELRKRFEYSTLFVVIGTYLSNFISFILVKYIQINLISIKIIFIFCIVFVLVGGLIITTLYKKIEDIKKKSIDYQKFLRHQGIGLNLKSIGSYYYNKNFLYLGIISFFGNLSGANTPQNFQAVLRTKEGQTGYSDTFVTLIELSQTIGILLTFQCIKFITMWYKSQVKFLKLSLMINLIISIIVYFSPNIPFIPLLLIFFLASMFQGVSGLYCVLICQQINYCLSDEKCSIKCIGLGILSFCQDLPITFFMIQMDTFLCLIIQTQMVFLTTIYSLYYLKNRSFENLEQDVQQQQNVESNIERLPRENNQERLL